MNDTKEWKEKTLRYIKQVENTRPVSFYELNSQMLGNSNILSILQELVTEDFMYVLYEYFIKIKVLKPTVSVFFIFSFFLVKRLEQRIEINRLSLDIPLDTVTLYFNKIKSEEHKVSAPTLRVKYNLL